MGHEPSEELDGELPEHVPSSIAALTPAPKHPAQADSPEPEVVAQQRAIAESFAPEEAEATPAPSRGARAGGQRCPSARPSPLPRRAARAGARPPSPLRLDGERHLRLRLANAVTGRSAQQIVTEALDRVPRLHSRSRSAGRAGSRLGRQEKLTRKGRSDDQDRLQSRRLDR